MNTLFAAGLSSYVTTTKTGELKSVSLHPGVILTSFSREFYPLMKFFFTVIRPITWLFFKDVEHGAATSLHCCLCPLEELEDKAYYSDCKVKAKTQQSSSVESEIKLW